MITEIPTASEFQAAGLNQLYLAWQIAMQAVQDYEAVADRVDEVDRESASTEYWAKSQPVLANAFGLIQQAMEMALKGHIASITPFLLISRDPKDWPKGVDTGAVPFSEFRTLDAADLVTVHNAFSPVPLDVHFRAFWDRVRRDRNKIMHSVSPGSFDPATLLRTVMTAAQALFADVRWPQRLLDMEADGKYAAYGLDDGTQNVVMRQVEIAVRHLTPAETRLFFGYDVKRRSYLCPNCYDRADRDWQDSWPKLAQFSSKSPGERALHCVVCDEIVEVERIACINPNCQGNVVYDGMCLTCVSSQDNPQGFRSGLADEELGREHRYGFVYGRGVYRTFDTRHLPDGETAKEHARLAMLAPHLTGWDTVTIYHESDGSRSASFELGSRGRLLGTWVRQEGGLTWEAGTEPDVFGRRPTIL
jgi:hypothetical protein